MRYLVYFSPLLLIGLWIFVNFIISKIGWSHLAKKYKLEEQKPDLKKVGVISAAINSINYRSAIICYQNKEGFSLKTDLMFRFFHKQVFIPWSELQEVRTKKVMFLEMKELIIGKPYVATIEMSKGTLKKLDIPEGKLTSSNNE